MNKLVASMVPLARASEMLYFLQSDPEHRVVLITFGTMVDEDSVSAVDAEIRSFIAAHGPYSGIADLSAVEKLPISADFVWRLAERPPIIPNEMTWVIVAPRPFTYGMSRMFQIIHERRYGHLEIAATLDAAFQLLSLESPQFRPIHSDQPRRLAAR